MDKRKAAEKNVEAKGRVDGGALVCEKCPFGPIEKCNPNGSHDCYKKCEKWLKENPVTKTERIEEIERELAALKAAVVEEEEVEYPVVRKDFGGVYLYFNEHGFMQIDNSGGDFGYIGHPQHSMSKKFTGKLEFKNGKPV